MMNLGDKSIMLLAAFALGGCPCAALATDPEPLLVDSVAIADLDGDSQPEMLVSNLTHENPWIELVLSQSSEHTRLVTLGANEIVIWENCKVADELGWQGSRAILISTDEETSEGEWITKCRVIDSESLLLLGQVVGIQRADEVGSVWMAQWRGDTNPDGIIDMLDLTDALSSAPYLFDEDNVQHRAFVGSADINIDGVLDVDEFVALTLSLEESDMPSHHAAAVAALRLAWLQDVIDWFTPCRACARDCGGLLLQLKNLVDGCNASLEADGCAAVLQASDPDLEQFAACYQEWNDCFIEMNNLAAGSIKCKCIYKCGPSLLSAPMLQVP